MKIEARVYTKHMKTIQRVCMLCMCASVFEFQAKKIYSIEFVLVDVVINLYITLHFTIYSIQFKSVRLCNFLAGHLSYSFMECSLFAIVAAQPHGIGLPSKVYNS